MTNTYTKEEVEYLRLIINDFPAFLAHLEIKDEDNVTEQLLSEKHNITVNRSSQPIVEAWVSWIMEYQSDRTMLWMSGLQRDALIVRDRIEQKSRDLGKFGGSVDRRGGVTHYAGGGHCLYRRASVFAGRGLSLNYMILDGLDPLSKLNIDLMNCIYPVVAVVPNSKIIHIID